MPDAMNPSDAPGAKTLYGDGRTLVVTHDGVVTFYHFAPEGSATLTMSEEAFREVVIGWTRYQEEKA